MKEYDIILDDQKTMSFHITECEEGSWTAGPEDQGNWKIIYSRCGMMPVRLL